VTEASQGPKVTTLSDFKLFTNLPFELRPRYGHTPLQVACYDLKRKLRLQVAFVVSVIAAAVTIGSSAESDDESDDNGSDDDRSDDDIMVYGWSSRKG
jgi:hypothetical protein